MPQEPIFIKKQPPKHPSMNYAFLRELGIQAVQRLSGQIWTDFNVHDPGVTILEQLCFAITDLGFRTDFSIQDLLNARSRKGRTDLNNTFFDASEILPSNPLTIEDYRILIIDRVQQVKNAWFVPVQDNLQGIKGLYKILLQIDDKARGIETQKRIRQQVFSLFSAHRNLCEDIELIEILEVEKITLNADIEISTETVAEEVLANILFKVEEYLNPTVKFYTLEEMLADGYLIEDIFDGTVPQHGFIKKSELMPIRQEVYISKIIEIISNVEGVRRITYFQVDKNDIPIEGDVVQIEPGNYAVLDMDTLNPKYNSSNYPAQFYRGALNYDLDLNTANQLLYSLFARYKKGYELSLIYREKDFPSILKQEDLGKYFSIQNHFPMTYGLSRFGLMDNDRPTRERLAMVKQLRGYLLIFEQVLANYLAQLANVKQLFAIDTKVDKTYFTQVPTNVPEVEEVLLAEISKSGLSEDVYKNRMHDAFLAKLEKINHRHDPFVQRRNRFLDHLLGRFGERFNTDFLLKVSAGYGEIANGVNPEIELINAKIRFLQNYVDISTNRAKGFDYLDSDASSWNVSGLEKRVSLLLNIATNSNESLLRIFHNQLQHVQVKPFHEMIDFISLQAFPKGFLDMESEAAQEIADQLNPTLKEDSNALEMKAAADKRRQVLDSLEEQLRGNAEDKQAFEKPVNDFLLDSELPQDGSTDLNYTPPTEIQGEAPDFISKFWFRAASRSELLLDLLSSGIEKYNYIPLKEGEDKFAVYYKGNKNIGVYKIREASSRLEAIQAIDALVAYLELVNKHTEGMHVVEHLLLRPKSKDEHYFYLLDDLDKILLESYKLGDQLEQKYMSEEIPTLGRIRSNYVIIPLEVLLARPENAFDDATNFDDKETPAIEDAVTTQLPIEETDEDAPKTTGINLSKNEEEDGKETIESEHRHFSALGEEGKAGDLIVLLKNDYDDYIARIPEPFQTRAAAEDAITNIIEFIDSFKTTLNKNKRQGSVFEKIRMDVRKKIEASIPDTFYSQELSIVMPNWTTRFQNADFRSNVKSMFMLNVPAHLHVDFYWIGIEEMEDFEHAYNDWIKERQAIEPRQPDLDKKALVVTELLGAYYKLVNTKRKKNRLK